VERAPPDSFDQMLVQLMKSCGSRLWAVEQKFMNEGRMEEFNRYIRRCVDYGAERAKPALRRLAGEKLPASQVLQDQWSDQIPF
jgi:hypothetical protein